RRKRGRSKRLLRARFRVWRSGYTRLSIEGGFMGLGVSIVLIAAGAILAWAVNANVSGVDIHTVGWILLIVGIVGAVLSMIFWSTWAGPGYWSGRRRGGYVDEGPPPYYIQSVLPGAAARPLRGFRRGRARRSMRCRRARATGPPAARRSCLAPPQAADGPLRHGPARAGTPHARAA